MKKNRAEEAVMEIAGLEGVLLYRALRGKKDFSEFKLAEKIDKDINATRNILYKLHNYNLANFIRKKDMKKGWYIYYWTFNGREAKRVYENLRKNKKEIIENKISSEKRGSFFVCSNGCQRAEFEEAFDANFKCPECGGILDYEDNAGKIRKLKEELELLC